MFLTSRQNVLESPEALFVWPEQEGLVQIPGIASRLAAHSSKIKTQREAVAGRKENALIRKASNLGRRWTYILRPTQKILCSHGDV